VAANMSDWGNVEDRPQHESDCLLSGSLTSARLVVTLGTRRSRSPIITVRRIAHVTAAKRAELTTLLFLSLPLFGPILFRSLFLSIWLCVPPWFEYCLDQTAASATCVRSYASKALVSGAQAMSWLPNGAS